MNGKLPKNEWPEELKHPEVKGVFVGGCVARGVGSRFRRKAHAHTHGEHRGWICYLSAKRLKERMLNLHELAHIVTREGHTKRWREYLLQIGGTLDEVIGLDGKVLMGSCHPRPKKKKEEQRPQAPLLPTPPTSDADCGRTAHSGGRATDV